ncbi:hypothetical protein N7478_005626 [Penicillium angulare]|uniref:uncharacterized protein n=1 Tax=Penicillium angulare TaxID=116970 RepID=UPI00253F7860|nr:uncharacterized protein N7478_005626 [Penicillium angulare]KAJ5280254.1 hypothetical protein N7478_005626 [Penicillium angulare]
MVGVKVFAGAAALMSSFLSASFALDVDLQSNVAVYYGQGANQPRLSHFCEETSMDIINLGFINVFPKKVGDWPGSNFGNQCDGTVYDGTSLLKGCHQIWEDIPSCKANGKTVLLSIGGDSANPGDMSDEVAEWFADFLWYSFGPVNASAVAEGFPRPFELNVLDGFDFDIESDGGDGYAAMINRLRSHYAKYPLESFYISGAPQCNIPDQQLSDAISNSHFDFIWVQFYNTDACYARAFISGALPGTVGFDFDGWVNVIKTSANPDAKLFVGLPAAVGAASVSSPESYLESAEVFTLVEYVSEYPEFGGIMLWEATYSDNNTDWRGWTYCEQMKEVLDFLCPPPVHSTTSTIPTVTPTPVHSSTVVPSSSVVTTSSSAVSSSSVASSSSVVASSSSASPTLTITRTVSPLPAHTSSSVPSSSASVQSSSITTSSSATHSSHSHSHSHAHSHSHGHSHSHVHSSWKPSGSHTPTGPHSTRTPSGRPHHSSSSSSSPSSSSSSSTPLTVRPTSSGLSSSVPESSQSSTSTLIRTSESTGLPSSISKSVTSVASSSSSGILETSTIIIGSGSTSNAAGSGSTSSATGVPQPSGGKGTTQTTITALPSVTSAPASSAPETITTVIVTSYTDICPTGFTTIWTTYTTYVCPETATTASATVTNPPSGASTTSATVPEGWTTTVTVCTQCAATPTTVTLTLPNPTSSVEATTETTAVQQETTGIPSAETTVVQSTETEIFTTTVSFCESCGPTGSSVTLTVPYTAPASIVTPTLPSSSSGVPGRPTSTALVPGAGGISTSSHSPSFVFHPTTTSTVSGSSGAPTSTPEGIAPAFNAAGSRSDIINIFSVMFAVVISALLM